MAEMVSEAATEIGPAYRVEAALGADPSVV